MEKLIRDPEFGKRLSQACDANFHCPPMHKGRLTWVAAELASRFKEKVSVESVRKWLAGETKPRRNKSAMLAELLSVDAVWLYMGIDAGLSPRDQKTRNAEASGIVNVVAGFIQMDGGHPAFPATDDAQAAERHVDLYAIIRGANYAFHIALGHETDDGGLRFPVPLSDGVIVLGLVRSGFGVRVAELSPEIIRANGQANGSSAMVMLSADEFGSMKVTDFANRL